ncbi:hypothetical protein ACP70R_010797 [Stipagrostis hirtigluma subsp. patula]
MCKLSITIPSLVLLRRTVRRWRARAATASSSRSGELGWTTTDAGAAAVPAGHVAVRVEGGDGSGGPRRFVVRLAHLGHPAFRELLRQAEEEYGFPAAAGPIALPCDEDHFLDVLHRASSSSTSCFCRPVKRRGRGDLRPLLQGMAVEKLVC